MRTKVLLCPERVRQTPKQFSWVDQRLARQGYFERASSDAWALYLFLLVVADAQGLSYYADTTLCQRLMFEPQQLRRARHALQQLGLIAYARPLYQVLALDRPPPAKPATPAMARQHLRTVQHCLGKRP